MCTTLNASDLTSKKCKPLNDVWNHCSVRLLGPANKFKSSQIGKNNFFFLNSETSWPYVKEIESVAHPHERNPRLWDLWNLTQTCTCIHGLSFVKCHSSPFVCFLTLYYSRCRGCYSKGLLLIIKIDKNAQTALKLSIFLCWFPFTFQNVPNECWQITRINDKYELCDTYPGVVSFIQNSQMFEPNIRVFLFKWSGSWIEGEISHKKWWNI